MDQHALARAQRNLAPGAACEDLATHLRIGLGHVDLAPFLRRHPVERPREGRPDPVVAALPDDQRGGVGVRLGHRDAENEGM
jgi:hypothetical protein